MLKIYSRKSRGLAGAFLLGLINSSGDIVGWIDSNMESVVEKIPDMIDKLDSNDIVVLSRYTEGGKDERSRLRILSSQFINLLSRSILNKEIKDYTSGIFVMKRSVLNEVVPISYGHGEFFVEFLYNAYKKGFKIKEIPHIQKKDYDIENSKSAPNLIKFIYHGTTYVLRVFSSIIRRKN